MKTLNRQGDETASHERLGNAHMVTGRPMNRTNWGSGSSSALLLHFAVTVSEARTPDPSQMIPLGLGLQDL